jgi:UDP-glucose 4-epimerase
MSEYQCKNFVYSSSATVYGIPPKTPIPETSPIQPESCYGRTKAMIEQVLADVCLAEKDDAGLKAISLRYFK